jgi:hypothetical protein
VPITIQHTQELLSLAYAYAVAAKAGLGVSHSIFDYGIDITFSEVRTLADGKRVPTGWDVHFQLKSTTDCSFRSSCVVYDLDIRNYNILTSWEGVSPCYLLLMRLPPEKEKWLAIKEDVLELRDCCYWHLVPRGAIIENKSSKRIEIRREQTFTPEALDLLMARHRSRMTP